MNPDSEAALVARARAGDKEAFGMLVEHLKPVARRIALRMLGDEDLAHEMVQEASLRAYLSLGRLRDDTRFKGWLYGTVLNVCRGYLRDRRAAPYSLEELLGGLPFEAIPFSATSPDPQDLAEDHEMQRLVLEAVRVLPSKSREATLLFYYEQLSLQEIAARLDLSIVAVKSRLHKARRRLRDNLLPAYPELAQQRPAIVPAEAIRSKAMRKVVIADVVQREIEGNRNAVVVLLDEEARRALPIWVGPWEGMSIALNLRKIASQRPMTYNFASNLLQAADAHLEEARIDALRGDTFIGTAKLRIGDKAQEIDARPSDAIALAAVQGSPVYVAEAVMDRAGIHVPIRDGGLPQFGRGIDRFVEEFRQLEARAGRPRTEQPQSEEDKEQERAQLWALLLGEE